MASRRGQQRLRNPTRPPLSPTPLHIHRGLLQSPGLPGCPFKLRVTHSIPNRACSQNQTGRAERPSHKNPQPEQMQHCAQAHSEGLHVVQSLSGVRLFVTSRTVYSPLGSSVHGILQPRTLEWVDISFSKGSSQPRDHPSSSASQAGSSPAEPSRKPKSIYSI